MQSAGLFRSPLSVTSLACFIQPRRTKRETMSITIFALLDRLAWWLCIPMPPLFIISPQRSARSRRRNPSADLAGILRPIMLFVSSGNLSFVVVSKHHYHNINRSKTIGPRKQAWVWRCSLRRASLGEKDSGCPQDGIRRKAVASGHFELLKWVRAAGCTWDPRFCHAKEAVGH